MKDFGILEIRADEEGLQVGFGSKVCELVGKDDIEKIFDEEFITVTTKKCLLLLDLMGEKAKAENRKMLKEKMRAAEAMGIDTEKLDKLAEGLAEIFKKALEG